jgi:hypothetical protein
MTKDDSGYWILPCRESKGGGWQEDPERREQIPGQTPLDVVLDRFVSQIIKETSVKS